ncbi:MAG: transcriptional regulator NrdR [Planctomycetaceae bacterium]|nr:transcriptional regulator NrdR [Planctomycetaceae bacterium]
MQCPFCGKNNDKVVDSRSSEGGRAIRRRRECLACQRRFTTYENPEEGIKLTVIKKDGSRVPYDRQKVIDGLERACYKRQITSEQIRSMVETVEDHLYRRFEKEVPSRVIGDLVSDGLRNVDKIAYMRFASVYRNFVDVGELIDEAQEVKDAPVVGPEQKELFGDNDS